MKFLKWLGLTIIGFFLFLSLSAFGVAFTANSTVLNPHFVASEINNFPFASWANQLIDENNNADMPPEFKTAIAQTISDLEPQIKKDLGIAASRSI